MIYDLSIPVDDPTLDPAQPVRVTVDLAGVGIPVGGGVSDHGALTGLSDDDHTQYAKKASNLSDLASASTARTNLGLGTAATAATGDFAAASHNHAASAITSGTVDTARLGSGTANSGTYLRGDQTWAAVSVPSAGWVPETLSATQQWATPGGHWVGALTQTVALGANVLWYLPVFFHAAWSLESIGCNVTSAGTNLRLGIVAAAADGQPTGNVIYGSGNIDVTGTGAKSVTGISGVTGSAGHHLFMATADAAVTLRAASYLCPESPTLISASAFGGGGNVVMVGRRVARTFAALSGTVPDWDTVTTSAAMFPEPFIVAKWSAA